MRISLGQGGKHGGSVLPAAEASCKVELGFFCCWLIERSKSRQIEVNCIFTFQVSTVLEGIIKFKRSIFVKTSAVNIVAVCLALTEMPLSYLTPDLHRLWSECTSQILSKYPLRMCTHWVKVWRFYVFAHGNDAMFCPTARHVIDLARKCGSKFSANSTLHEWASWRIFKSYVEHDLFI